MANCLVWFRFIISEYPVYAGIAGSRSSKGKRKGYLMQIGTSGAKMVEIA